MTDTEFLTAFEAATLPRPEWTHEAHVRMAWLYLTRSPAAAAMEKVRSGIRKLNAAFAAAANPKCKPAGETPAGYHDTITVAFVRVIAGRLTPGEDFATFRDRHPDLFDRHLTALLRHYTKKRLFSTKARNSFIEPDRSPLPAVGPWANEAGQPRKRPRRVATPTSA